MEGVERRVGAGRNLHVEAREEMFERYVVPELEVLMRVALSLVNQIADAEDLVQDTLLRAYRSVDRFDGRHARAWLLTIMRNANKNRTRRQRPRLLDDSEYVDTVPAADSANPDQAVDSRFDSCVEKAMSALTQNFQEVLTLVDIDGLSYAEAATVLGVPTGTVMSRLHRARKTIRNRLAATGLDHERRAGRGGEKN
ncbi:MAG: sigma-70 family RNA polymerase sigma factor [Actinomycetota bacterium]|nr:sigma-70 family RNA polymerase sigma factor [Actinomycetota bacterium]